MIPKSTVLTSLNLKLRIPELGDIANVYSASRYDGFTDGMLWSPPETMEELVEPLNRSIKAWEEGAGYSFTIVRKGSEEFFGRISIRQTKEEGVWDVGFWTHPEEQGKGIMSEALGVILDFGFNKLNAQRIEACHAIGNAASQKVMQRNNMQFVRYIEKGFKKNGVWIDENRLAIDRHDWSGR